MIAGPSEFYFLCFGVLVFAMVAFRPNWAFYLLTYGHPEKVDLKSLGVKVVRIMSGFIAIGLIVMLMGYVLTLGL